MQVGPTEKQNTCEWKGKNLVWILFKMLKWTNYSNINHKFFKKYFFTFYKPTTTKIQLKV